MDVNSFIVGYTKGKQSASGGCSMEGFHKVRFFNDDRTTLLYTVFVPTGASAMYAGETPISTEGRSVFSGFEPSPSNVTTDMDCFAVYDVIGTLNDTSWEKIAELSEEGLAQNFFHLGDTKMIHIEGTVGTKEVNGDYGVYIIGFDHNEELEGKGIHFGTFKNSEGVDTCLYDSKRGKSSTNGSKCFNMNHMAETCKGGWAGCDLRYDVLGSTDVKPKGYNSTSTSKEGYNPSPNCASDPVADTLMAALPADLRAVMKPMTKYSDNSSNSGSDAGFIKVSIDYLPLLSVYETFGNDSYANSHESNKQKQYDYFKEGNSTTKGLSWWTRSKYAATTDTTSFCIAGTTQSGETASYSHGLAPIFKV